MSDEERSGPGELPVVDGSIYGATAYMAGYLVTLVLVAVFEGRRFVGDIVEGAGWIYYNAQFVSIEQRTMAAGQFEDVGSINYVTGAGLGDLQASTTVVPALVYHVIPIVAFFVAGFLLARSVGARSIPVAAKVGASIAFGAVVLALGGTFVFEVANALGPNRPESVALAGITYPVVCGAVGGVTAVLVDHHVLSGDASKAF